MQSDSTDSFVYVVSDPLVDTGPITRATTEKWWKETMQKRLENKDVKKIIIMSRLHEADLTGYILPDDSSYEHLVLPLDENAR